MVVVIALMKAVLLYDNYKGYRDQRHCPQVRLGEHICYVVMSKKTMISQM